MDTQETEIRKNLGGRPTKWTAEVESILLKGIEEGLPYKAACARSGIHYDTLNEWRKQFPEFSAAIKKAEAEAISRRLALIEVAAATSWQAAAWLLERRHPDMFGKPETQFAQQINVNASLNNENKMTVEEVFAQWRSTGGNIHSENG